MDALADSTKIRRLTHRETQLIVIGMLLPVFMGSLDQTILASALPSIGRDLGDAPDLPWLITAYLLASTAVVPLYGKIADIHGRAFSLRIAIAAHLAGSLVCALAPSMLVLMLARGLQGIGGGGLSSMGMVVLGDVAPPRQRGRYYAYFAATYTTAGAVGPALGGFLADHLSWSAIFWLNLPLGLAAYVVTTTLLRGLPRHERPHRLDLIGAILIVTASVSLMLGLNLAGIRFSWVSLPILALFASAAIVGALFVLRLLTAPEPLIPVAILLDPVVRCSFIANALGWASIVGLNIFLPSYLQSVAALTPTDAGLALMALMMTLNISAGLTSGIVCRMRRYKTLPIAGLLIALAAVLAHARRAEQNHIRRFVDEAQGPQFADLPLVDRRLKRKIELIEGLHKRKMRQLQPGFEISLPARLHFCANHVQQKVGVTRLLFGRPLQQRFHAGLHRAQSQARQRPLQSLQRGHCTPPTARLS